MAEGIKECRRTSFNPFSESGGAIFNQLIKNGGVSARLLGGDETLKCVMICIAWIHLT